MAHPLRLFVALLVGTFSGCAQLPERDRVPVQHALPTPDTPLSRYMTRLLAEHPGMTAFHALPGGLDAFVARMVLIEKAQSSVDVQYYLFHDDLIGKLVAAQLLSAADRGVRVRLLLDDWGLAGKDDALLAIASHPNIEIRLFNPFASRRSRAGEVLSDFGRINRRMHNKSLTIDNLISIVGGRNIGNEYFDADPEVAFGDMDVLMAGPAMHAVQESFDAFWNSEVTYPIGLLHYRTAASDDLPRYRASLGEFALTLQDSPYLQRLHDSPLAQELRTSGMQWQWGQASILADEPRKVLLSAEDSSTHLMPQLQPLVTGVQHELLVFSPYFIPGEEGMAFFRALIARGVRVVVVTNSLASTDVGVVYAGYARYRKPLIEAGVELYEMRAQGKSRLHMMSGATRASLHAKTFVFDRQQVFIGSLNLDPRSSRINTEIGVIIDNPDVASTMARQTLDNLPDGAYHLVLDDGVLVWESEGLRFTHEPDTGWLRRLGLWLLKPFLVESQL